jgi:cell pole-organizing protein PopZ
MSDTNAPEPTMEEILASIRRIISEDDPTPAKAASPPPPPNAPVLEAALPPGPAPEPVHEPLMAYAPSMEPPEDDVLELNEPLAPEPSYAPEPPAFEPPPVYRAPSYETLGALDLAPPSAPSPRTPPPSYDRGEPLVSDPAAGAAASYFGQLSRSLAMPADGRTLEDVVVTILRPMLKDWLDRYLPQIVESKVQAEVERISRSNVH